MTKTKIHTINWRADAWLSGTIMLKPNEGWLYVTIINLIYSQGGAIEPDIRFLGRVTNMHGNAVRAALERLIELGKVWRETSGKLMAKRCENELETARKRVGKWVENGGDLGRQSKKTKGLSEAPLTPPSRTRVTTTH